MPTGNLQKAMKIGRPSGGKRKENKDRGRITHQPLPQSDNEEGSEDLEAPAGRSRAPADAASGAFWSPARFVAVTLLVALLLMLTWPYLAPVALGEDAQSSFARPPRWQMGEEVVVEGFGTGTFAGLVSNGAHAGRAQVKLSSGRLVYLNPSLLHKAPQAPDPVWTTSTTMSMIMTRVRKGEEVFVEGIGTGKFIGIPSTGSHAGRAKVKPKSGGLVYVDPSQLHSANSMTTRTTTGTSLTSAAITTTTTGTSLSEQHDDDDQHDDGSTLGP